ncbi:MAG: hypothetical protein MR278_02805 [Bacteroidales bacterium]|nr:hypothetical protein [Anaerotignum sp.]MCI5678902.1 hypothetical protein [Bacteroidales bacterium]MDY3925910.1 hypothetical protein [Anaerotignum sp.]
MGTSGNFDPKKDYAAAIKKETDPAKKAQLQQERQNKINWMNATGQNKKGYTNDIYKGSNSSGSKSSSSSSKNSSSGYYDPNKDYAAAIKNATSTAEKNQLMAERQNKIDAMNAAGTNKNGYTNDIYKETSSQAPAPVTPKGIWQSQDMKINNAAQTPITYAGNPVGQTPTSAPEQNAAQQTAAGQSPAQQTAIDRSATQQTAAGTPLLDGISLQAYLTRKYSNQKAEDGTGAYIDDSSMSLPDQAKLKRIQADWNRGKAAGNQEIMDAAHKAAEALRDNYRYYPLKNSNGYGLGENDIGFIRDIVVRGDELGNKYIDQYNGNSVTTTRYDKDGNFVNRHTGSIAGHDARVAAEMAETARRRAVQEKDNPSFAVRLGDAADSGLSLGDIREKYGGGITADNYGMGLYTAPIYNPEEMGVMAMAQGQTAQNAFLQGAEVKNASQSPIQYAGNTMEQAWKDFGYFDPKKDYAAAINNAGSTQEMLQAQQERQNKINWMNANGLNPKGYTNQIYSNYQNLLQMPQYGTGQQSGGFDTNGGYGNMPEYQGMSKDELFSGYNDMAASLEDQRNALLKMTLAQNQAAQDAAGAEYDDLARQAYILKRQQEVALPQQLAALGISGGGSETANLQLATNYQNNLNQNEQERQQMLKDYALQALQAQTQANSDISGYYADAKQQAMNAWQNERANQNSWNQWAAGFRQQLNEYQNSLNQQQYQEILANRQYQNDLKQQQINLALQMGDYKKLAALGFDPSYLKRMQDAELEQMALEAALTRANIAKVNRSVTKGSGGGKSGGSGSGSGSGGTTDLTITNQDNGAAIYVPGLRWVSYSDLDKMIEAGTVKEEVNGSKLTYKKVW